MEKESKTIHISNEFGAFEGVYAVVIYWFLHWMKHNLCKPCFLFKSCEKGNRRRANVHFVHSIFKKALNLIHPTVFLQSFMLFQGIKLKPIQDIGLKIFCEHINNDPNNFNRFYSLFFIENWNLLEKEQLKDILLRHIRMVKLILFQRC